MKYIIKFEKLNFNTIDNVEIGNIITKNDITEHGSNELYLVVDILKDTKESGIVVFYIGYMNRYLDFIQMKFANSNKSFEITTWHKCNYIPISDEQVNLISTIIYDENKYKNALDSIKRKTNLDLIECILKYKSEEYNL
jgi:hypothetical protein